MVCKEQHCRSQLTLNWVNVQQVSCYSHGHFDFTSYSLTLAITTLKLVLNNLSMAMFYEQLAVANGLQMDVKIIASGTEKTHIIMSPSTI